MSQPNEPEPIMLTERCQCQEGCASVIIGIIHPHLREVEHQGESLTAFSAKISPDLGLPIIADILGKFGVKVLVLGETRFMAFRDLSSSPSAREALRDLLGEVDRDQAQSKRRAPRKRTGK